MSGWSDYKSGSDINIKISTNKAKHRKITFENTNINENIKDRVKSKSIETMGYLNLLANGFDNFSHGLAISASFMTGIKTGFLTTFTIIIHEIPHEFGDFAILLRSGFSKWDAIKAQLFTSSIGICGAIFALLFDYFESTRIQIWVLPFTCGAFINIALVNILPQLLKEDNTSESIKQLLMIGLGIGVMAVVSCFE